jgi:hypothetical protein
MAHRVLCIADSGTSRGYDTATRLKLRTQNYDLEDGDYDKEPVISEKHFGGFEVPTLCEA